MSAKRRCLIRATWISLGTGGVAITACNKAKGNEKVAKAELEDKRKATAHSQYEVDKAKAEAAYDVAKEKCEDLKGSDQHNRKKLALDDDRRSTYWASSHNLPSRKQTLMISGAEPGPLVSSNTRGMAQKRVL